MINSRWVLDAFGVRWQPARFRGRPSRFCAWVLPFRSLSPMLRVCEPIATEWTTTATASSDVSVVDEAVAVSQHYRSCYTARHQGKPCKLLLNTTVVDSTVLQYRQQLVVTVQWALNLFLHVDIFNAADLCICRTIVWNTCSELSLFCARLMCACVTTSWSVISQLATPTQSTIPPHATAATWVH